MRFALTFDCDNDAFYPFTADEDEPGFDPGPEVARILRDVLDRIVSGSVAGTVSDRNGNTVGSFSFSEGG